MLELTTSKKTFYLFRANSFRDIRMCTARSMLFLFLTGAAAGCQYLKIYNNNLLMLQNGSPLFALTRRHLKTKKKYRDPRTPNPYRRLYKHLSMGPTVESIAQSLSFKGYDAIQFKKFHIFINPIGECKLTDTYDRINSMIRQLG